MGGLEPQIPSICAYYTGFFGRSQTKAHAVDGFIGERRQSGRIFRKKQRGDIGCKLDVCKKRYRNETSEKYSDITKASGVEDKTFRKTTAVSPYRRSIWVKRIRGLINGIWNEYAAGKISQKSNGQHMLPVTLRIDFKCLVGTPRRRVGIICDCVSEVKQ